MLTAGRSHTTKSTTQLNLKETSFLGKRYESTAAASDASAAPPAEKYEYQAEVC